MEVTLGTRTAETAAIYFRKTDSETFRKLLPQKAKTVEEAVADFYATQRPGASSYGRTILADGRHVGDVWCYCIDLDGLPNAMVSYCVFEPSLWGQGVGSEALGLFLREIVPQFGLKHIGAFTFADNLPSIRVLEKNGFRLAEELTEDGIASKYFELHTNAGETPQRLEVNGREYAVLKLLGKGKGGYSYLAQDGARRVVVKQIHHEPCDYYQFGDKLAAECGDYQRLEKIGIPMPRLLDVDNRQERIVKEYIDGDTVYQMVLEDALPPYCLEQMREMCRSLYAAGVNIDYFPTNFVLRDGVLYYIDYECNDYMEQWDFEHWGVKYWSKTPEFLQYAAGQSHDGPELAGLCEGDGVK